MPTIQITSDGTVTGTALLVDGKDITKNQKVVGIQMYARAPYVSSYSGETIEGSVSVGYELAGENGTIETRSLYGSSQKFSAGMGKIKNTDEVTLFIGHEATKEVQDLVDKITNHCKENNIACPTAEDLKGRTIESLTDKAQDLGLLEQES